MMFLAFFSVLPKISYLPWILGNYLMTVVRQLLISSSSCRIIVFLYALIKNSKYSVNNGRSELCLKWGFKMYFELLKFVHHFLHFPIKDELYIYSGCQPAEEQIYKNEFILK